GRRRDRPGARPAHPRAPVPETAGGQPGPEAGAAPAEHGAGDAVGGAGQGAAPGSELLTSMGRAAEEAVPRRRPGTAPGRRKVGGGVSPPRPASPPTPIGRAPVMKHVVRSLVLPLALAAAVVAVGLNPASGQKAKDTKDAKDTKTTKAVAT